MATDGEPKEIVFYAISFAILVWCVLFGAKGPFLQRGIATIIFFGMLFLALKAGFVRHDYHAYISGEMIVLAALLASTLYSENKAVLSIAPAVMTWIYIDARNDNTSTERLITNFESTSIRAWNGFKERIAGSEKYQRHFDARIAKIKARAELPVLHGTTDIYSYDQSFLIASGSKWNPRPILQSYSAYSNWLVEKNKDHLLGDRRPDNIVFSVQPIDKRLPSLEDGASWPILLSNYEPTSLNNGYLFLKHRRPDSIHPYSSSSISKGHYQLGERIDVPKHAGLIFAKINIRRTLIGKISNILLKPSRLEITLALENGVDRRYRMVASMAESGFLLSPLIESTEEFSLLPAGTEYLKSKKVKSITIDATSVRRRIFWRDDFEIELFSIDYAKNPDYIRLYGFSQPADSEAFPTPIKIDACDGSINLVDDLSPVPGPIKTEFLLKVHGRLALPMPAGEAPDDLYLVLTDSLGYRLLVKTKHAQDPDDTHFGQLHVKSFEYNVNADVSRLKGRHDLGLAYSKNGALNLCTQVNVPASIGEE